MNEMYGKIVKVKCVLLIDLKMFKENFILMVVMRMVVASINSHEHYHLGFNFYLQKLSKVKS